MKRSKKYQKKGIFLTLSMLFLASFSVYCLGNQNFNNYKIGLHRRNILPYRIDIKNLNKRQIPVFSKKNTEPDKIKINFLLGTVRYNDSSSVSCYLANKNDKDVVLKKYDRKAKDLVNRQLFAEQLIKNKNFKKEPIIYIDSLFETDNIINLNNITFEMVEKSLWTIEDLKTLTNLLICYPYHEQKNNILQVFNNNLLDNRNNFIKKVIKESLIELNKIYQTNISLGTIDPGSIVLSTLNDVEHKNLKVYFTKLGNSINTDFKNNSILINPRNVYDYSSLTGIKTQVEIIKKKRFI